MDNVEDYLAELNLKGTRSIWRKNHTKIDFVLKKSDSYVKKAKNVCDIGIGDGYALELMYTQGKNVTGVEISGYSVRHLTKYFTDKGMNIDLINANVSDLDIPTEFDIITCFDILEHLEGESLREAIENISKWLSKTGYLIATLPLGENLERGMVMCPKCNYRFHKVGHYHSFDDIGAVEKLISPHFELVKWGKVPPKIFPIDFLDKLSLELYRYMCKKKGIGCSTTMYFIAKHKADKLNV